MLRSNPVDYLANPSTAGAPRILSVKVEKDSDGPGYLVYPVWSGVDRARGTGYTVLKAAQAQRLSNAMQAGAVFYNARVARDVYGKTYVQADTRVLGRYLDSDLRKLGF